MQGIKIVLKRGWNYKFITDDRDALIHDTRKCPCCESVYFDTVYCYIVDSIKEAGLLHEDFEEICCCCLVLRRFGLLDLRSKLLELIYKKEDDYLLLEFCYSQKLDDNRIISIGIHDWSKIKLF